MLQGKGAVFFRSFIITTSNILVLDYIYECVLSECLSMHLVGRAHRTQNRVSEHLGLDSFKLPCGCSELNLGPLEKNPVLLAT